MPAKNTTNGDRVATPQPFSIFVSKNPKYVGVRIGNKRAYASAEEVFVLAEPVCVRATRDGLLIVGEGVVRQTGETIRIMP